ncbi:MAG: hypothetical protein HKN23_01665 [Verrucomicrobiales bacterium]|nr:hypothetical protein [Verrucomicrobiales bacterium]
MKKHLQFFTVLSASFLSAVTARAGDGKEAVFEPAPRNPIFISYLVDYHTMLIDYAVPNPSVPETFYRADEFYTVTNTLLLGTTVADTAIVSLAIPLEYSYVEQGSTDPFSDFGSDRSFGLGDISVNVFLPLYYTETTTIYNSSDFGIPTRTRNSLLGSRTGWVDTGLGVIQDFGLVEFIGGVTAGHYWYEGQDNEFIWEYRGGLARNFGERFRLSGFVADAPEQDISRVEASLGIVTGPAGNLLEFFGSHDISGPNESSFFGVGYHFSY